MQVGNSLRITIPKEIAKHVGLERGDVVELWVDNHSMIMEKKVFVYDAIWSFQEDILVLRSNLSKNFKAHTSQPIGTPLHRYRGQLIIERARINLRGEDVDSKEPTSLLLSLQDVKDIYLGWDDTLRRFKDTRGSIRPLRITFQEGTGSRKLYVFAKKTDTLIYGKENESIVQMLEK